MTDIGSHSLKRFALSWHYKFIILPIIVGLSTFGLFQDQWRPFDKYIFPIICLYIWWAVLFTSYKVEIENRKISFFRIIGKIEVQAEEVEKIVHRIASVRILHKKGKVIVTGLIDNLQGLLTTITSLNPEVVVKKFR